jgi:molecular chaperone GrpE
MAKKPPKNLEYLVEDIAGDVVEKINKLKKRLKKAQKEAEEYLNGWQRERADFVNYKKDVEKYLEKARQNVKQEVLLQYINTIDHIELMIRHAHDAIIKTDWYKGVENAHKQAINALKGMSVEEIPVQKGDKFNPNLFEAVEGEGDTVEEVLRKGYKIGDKVLRPAQVKLTNK